MSDYIEIRSLSLGRVWSFACAGITALNLSKRDRSFSGRAWTDGVIW